MNLIFPIIFIILGFLVELLNISSRSEYPENKDQKKQNLRGLFLVPFCFYIVGIAFYDLPENFNKAWCAGAALLLHLVCYFLLPVLLRKKDPET